MKEAKWKPSKRQKQAFEYLLDNETTELFYGGGAGGGKSYLGCVWSVYMCLRYPGVRGLMGRAVLKSLKESTLLSFFMVCRAWGLKKDKDYRYNSMAGVITFTNGSEIYLKDLFLYPSDPEFDSLGSTEYTFAFLDEVSQITEKAKNIVMSRLRYKLDEFGLVPKILMASNPTKNFAYREYYKPYMEGKLPKYKKFVPALVGDNPFISDYYQQNLKKLDKVSKERLLYGNWEYDDDPAKLFEYEKLLDMFGLFFQVGQPRYRWLTVDVARYGEDKTVFVYWEGLHIAKIKLMDKSSTVQVRKTIEHLCLSHQIPFSQVVIDEDGIGGGIVDEMKESGKPVIGFVNNSRPYETKVVPKHQFIIHNFANLKAQCYFKLAEYVNSAKISCYKDIPINFKNMLIEDLEQIKAKDIDKDRKLSIIDKETMKENLGRSPDIGDAVMMRMIGEIKKEYQPYIAV